MTSTSICGPAPMTPSGACVPPRRKTSRTPIPRRKIPAWAGNDVSEDTRLGGPADTCSTCTAKVELGIMKTRAAVAFEAKKPLEIVEVDLDGPKAGEVLVEIKATGIC